VRAIERAIERDSVPALEGGFHNQLNGLVKGGHCVGSNGWEHLFQELTFFDLLWGSLLAATLRGGESSFLQYTRKEKKMKE